MPAGLRRVEPACAGPRFIPGSPTAGPTPASPQHGHRHRRQGCPPPQTTEPPSPGSVSPEEEKGSVENVLLKTSAEGRMVKILANTKALGPLSAGGPQHHCGESGVASPLSFPRGVMGPQHPRHLLDSDV